MNKPYISVLMPLYDHQDVVSDAIQSVLNQTFTDFELVVCDDGSTDQSFDVAASFQDPRIKLWRKPNGGTTTALNSCILNSTGQVFCWLSADDIYEPHKLMEHFKAHKFEGCNFSIANWGLIDRGIKKPQTQSRHSGVGRMIPQLVGNYINGLSVGIDRSVFLRHGPFDIRYKYAQDYQKWLKILSTEDPYYIDGDPASYSRLGTSHLLANNQLTPYWCGILDNIRALLEHTEELGLYSMIPAEFQGNDIEVNRFIELLAETGCTTDNYFSIFSLRECYASLLTEMLEQTKYDSSKFVQSAARSHNADYELLRLVGSGPKPAYGFERKKIFYKLLLDLNAARFSDEKVQSAISYYSNTSRF